MAAGDFTAFGIVEGNALKELISNMEISGGGSKNEYGKNVGGRIGYNIPLEDGSLDGYELVKVDVTKLTREALKEYTELGNKERGEKGRGGKERGGEERGGKEAREDDKKERDTGEESVK